ncbi:MAG: response regulator transcription factor [Spirochaetia bacterium]|jgi:DNA-binding response OmpR family regulator|nr:response regulator transcription factor [Spirochaetia bacterium]
MKILLVDDEKEIITILKNYFEANGHITIPAGTGKSALNLFNEKKFDVIVLDIMLPDIEGTEVCRIIRNTSDIPILMLSAKAGDIDQILALGLGADEYAIKPFSPSVILAKINAVHIRKIREKLEIDPGNPKYIQTIWGIGYKFNGKNE